MIQLNWWKGRDESNRACSVTAWGVSRFPRLASRYQSSGSSIHSLLLLNSLSACLISLYPFHLASTPTPSFLFTPSSRRKSPNPCSHRFSQYTPTKLLPSRPVRSAQGTQSRIQVSLRAEERRKGPKMDDSRATGSAIFDNSMTLRESSWGRVGGREKRVW